MCTIRETWKKIPSRSVYLQETRTVREKASTYRPTESVHLLLNEASASCILIWNSKMSTARNCCHEERRQYIFFTTVLYSLAQMRRLLERRDGQSHWSNRRFFKRQVRWRNSGVCRQRDILSSDVALRTVTLIRQSLIRCQEHWFRPPKRDIGKICDRRNLSV